MPKRQKAPFEIETNVRLRLAQRVGVQLPRAQAQTFLKSTDLVREAVNCNAVLGGVRLRNALLMAIVDALVSLFYFF